MEAMRLECQKVRPRKFDNLLMSHKQQTAKQSQKINDMRSHSPEGTPYEGGTFQVQLHVSEQYPFQAPKARFVTKIFHPNIHFKTGEVGL
jgi:ubiquitin-protein ligase